MDGHLIAIKVRIECSTDQGMKLDCLAFNQHRLKRLDTEAVQGWSPIEHHRMLLDNLLKDIPDLGFFLLHHLLGALDGGRQATLFKLLIDKGFEQLKSHFLGQTALMQLQLRTDDDNRTTGVINPFTKQVLTETAPLAL